MPRSGLVLSRISRLSPLSRSPLARVRRAVLLAPLALAALPAHAQDAGEAPDLVLDPIVVTANATDTAASEVGSAVTVVQGKELEQQQVRVVADVLQQVPGVSVTRTGPMGATTTVRIRGSEGNQTLVMIDGIEVNNPAASSEYDFSNLLAQEVERVEVLRGPQSALYGSDAVGGVVNIITRRGDGKPTLTLKGEAGTLGSGEGLATVSGGTDRYDYLFSAAGLHTDNISVADKSNGNTEKDPFSTGTFLAKGGYRPVENLELSAVGRYTRSDFSGDGYWGGIGAVDDNSSTLTNQGYARAQAKLDLLENTWQHILGLSITSNDQEYRYGGVKDSTFNGGTGKVDYRTNYFLDTSAGVAASHIFTFGADYQHNAVTTESAWSSVNESYDEESLTGQYQVTLFESLALTGAVRQDFNQKFDDATTFRLTGAYTFAQTGTKVRGSYGTGVKNPSLFELYGYTGTYRGNPDLKPEEARGWDVGIDQPLWGNRIEANVTWFDQRITDLITGSGESSINLPGTSTINGLELGLTVRPIDDLTIRGAYTWMDGTDSDGVQLVRRPENSGSVSVNYAFLDQKANINLTVIAVGEQTDDFYDAFYNASKVTLDAYTLVNIAGSYQMTEKAQLFARVENLLDQDYQEAYTYGTAGITAYGGVKITF